VIVSQSCVGEFTLTEWLDSKPTVGKPLLNAAKQRFGQGNLVEDAIFTQTLNRVFADTEAAAGAYNCEEDVDSCATFASLFGFQPHKFPAAGLRFFHFPLNTGVQDADCLKNWLTLRKVACITLE
jgi:hypothetical protein